MYMQNDVLFYQEVPVTSLSCIWNKSPEYPVTSSISNWYRFALLCFSEKEPTKPTNQMNIKKIPYHQTKNTLSLTDYQYLLGATLGKLVFVKSTSGSNVTESNMNWQILAGCFGRSGCWKPPHSKTITGWMFSAYLGRGFPKPLLWLCSALYGLKSSEK